MLNSKPPAAPKARKNPKCPAGIRDGDDAPGLAIEATLLSETVAFEGTSHELRYGTPLLIQVICAETA